MSETTDRLLMDHIRRHGPLTISEMAAFLGVTQTAVRNRLTRLVESGLVEKRSQVGARGRPKHTYQASVEAQKRLGQNYTDLALVLWDEMMRSVEDLKMRRVMFGHIIDKMADLYRAQITGEAWEGRLVQLGSILNDRGVETEVSDHGDLPILKQHSCPYFALAETDRSVCAMERKMFEKVLGLGLRLSRCRLDGHRSCDFEAKPAFEPSPAQAG